MYIDAQIIQKYGSIQFDGLGALEKVIVLVGYSFYQIKEIALDNQNSDHTRGTACLILARRCISLGCRETAAQYLEAARTLYDYSLRNTLKNSRLNRMLRHSIWTIESPIDRLEEMRKSEEEEELAKEQRSVKNPAK